MDGKKVQPLYFENATLLMTGLMGFDTLCAESKPSQIIKFLNDFYSIFDGLVYCFDCFKVEHNSDSVLIVSGIFGESPEQGARELARLALFSMIDIRGFVIHHRPQDQAKLRIAVTSGLVQI